jgi:hypothetical protein
VLAIRYISSSPFSRILEIIREGKCAHIYLYIDLLTNSYLFSLLWEQIISIIMKYIRNTNKKTVNVISAPDKSATKEFQMPRAFAR